ncbi:MAG TPA: hypothetical protein DD458_09460 [Prolixibacteraceae bacterium]|nr:MAG: hypothetical protein A2W92_18760 [Bacteroidetes bacterium GWA2_42_15]OFY02542.1 MAG: hypothetical protein A2W89_22010 [Bacteroidetes bacterium GWE2_42_39]HBL75440.1 hypothetical protein [Prolixibacteraceae bacterium]HCU60651.1 hypothetical protein [Prolixibacteraceae bacterium]
MTHGQDTSRYELRLSVPVLDFPQNSSLPYHAPSMNQALELSNDFYEFGFWGIDKLGDRLFISEIKPYSKWRKFSNNLFKYGLGLGFSKYGSELPIPLGVWAHEEFHRSVLGINDISAKNGNWLLNRWDGTVYGVSDAQLGHLKSTNINQLLYSYVAGVQYEIALNEKITLNDFYKKRTLAKNALLLYNAFYVFDYFRFSTSAASDSVKVLAPPNESKNPLERDFAGADLTAWVFDMFNPSAPFSSRESFPNGEGVNRRIGFSDLSSEAQSYLVKQKKMSLLNFLNPAIFFINRIKLNTDFSFNFFTQYSPTHFGNDVAVFLPVQYKKYDLLINVHNYNNKTSNGLGIGLGLYNFRLKEKIESNFTLNMWNQPESFFDNKMIFGGLVNVNTKYYFRKNFAGFVAVEAKTQGWAMDNPHLKNNISVQLGFNYNLVR